MAILHRFLRFSRSCVNKCHSKLPRSVCRGRMSQLQELQTYHGEQAQLQLYFVAAWWWSVTKYMSLTKHRKRREQASTDARVRCSAQLPLDHKGRPLSTRISHTCAETPPFIICTHPIICRSDFLLARCKSTSQSLKNYYKPL